MDIALDFLSKAWRWILGSGSDSQVLLGIVFSFNTGLALLKKFKDELNSRLLSAVRSEIETARNAGWLGDLSIIDDISSASFRCAVRSLVIERDRLESGEYPFVVWSAHITRTLMLVCATIALGCMIVPCTARWTVCLIKELIKKSRYSKADIDHKINNAKSRPKPSSLVVPAVPR